MIKCLTNPAKIINIAEGSLEIKLPTIWTDEKQRWAESQKRREGERESPRRQKIRARKKVGKSRNIVQQHQNVG